ncbi:MFS transporter [Nocardiopsis tropica]|uniref:MFS transporter n=1 Tax=Nocardiopsis tropica TaxID=109330 RepID=A0ABU7KXY6_9ACTN|nr:MFS transporter [Nocardiopsis umidischolae]MEE2054171.1 MFS transporter [Nocardiopsis umidischolae]
MTENTTSPPRAGRREWAGLALLLVPAMLVMMDLSLLHLAVPRLSADLAPTATQLLWITDIYGFLIAGLLLTMGTLGDRVGRRRMILVGAAAFGSASVLAAFATSAESLILARALLGAAGSTLAPSTLSLITTMFRDPGQRTFAISLWMTSFMAGGALGPVVGGVMLEFFWWGSVFLLAVPVMLPLLVFGRTLLPEFRDPDAGRLDLTSALMSLAAVLLLVYGLKETVRGGAAVAPVLALLLGGAVATLFVLRQRRMEHPLLDLSLFRNRGFGTVLVTLLSTALLLSGVQFLVAQHMQMVLGLSPLRAGLWALPMVAGGLVAVMAASAAAGRIRPGVLFPAGLLVAACGFALLARVEADSALAVVVAGSVLMFTGLMPVSALGTDVVMATAPPERSGSAAAMTETTQELGGALGIAVIGTVGSGVYAADLGANLPEGLPEGAAEAAGQTLGSALHAADGLSARLGAELSEVAREAFTSGLQVASAASAVLLVVLALAVLPALRRVRPGGGAGGALEETRSHPSP